MTHSFGLPANISISFRKLLWFCAVRNEIPPFPAGKEIVSGIQTLTKGSHKGSLQAHMEPCTASQQCVSHMFPVQPVFTNIVLLSLLTYVAFWQGVVENIFRARCSFTSITVSQSVTDSIMFPTQNEVGKILKTRLNFRDGSKSFYEYSFIQMFKHHLFCHMYLSVYANFTIFVRNKMADHLIFLLAIICPEF